MPNTHLPNVHTITLNDQMWDRLLIALGTVTSAAGLNLGLLTRDQVLELVNAVNLDNPRFIPYDLSSSSPRWVKAKHRVGQYCGNRNCTPCLISHRIPKGQL